jgi:orotidine-5'-phosphate decarboxylase
MRDSSVRTGLVYSLRMTKAADKIIVALDVATEKKALDLVDKLRGDISFFKVGLQLYTVAGPEVVRQIRATGAKVFLDLKLHDIPNTVARVVESAAELGVQMLTIHLSGGAEMIRAAVTARKEGISILGVTVLTSLTDESLQEIGITERINKHVLRLTQLGVSAGVDGVVASPFEVQMLRAEFGDKIKIVTPGVRPRWAEAGDQKRFMTPRDALAAGADYLVIGRPITAHPKPHGAVAIILDELKG